MNKLLSKFGLFILYNLILTALFYGVFIETGSLFFKELLSYYIAFIISFFIVAFFIPQLKEKAMKKLSLSNSIIISNAVKNRLFYFLFFSTIVGIIIHFIDIGFIPIYKALQSADYYEVAGIRKQANLLTNKEIRYLSSFLIKSIIPFLLIYLTISKKYKLYTIIYVIGIIYAFSLMQKSFIITILLPCICYTIYYKKYKLLAKHLIVLTVYIFSLLVITNPQVSLSQDQMTQNVEMQTENPIIIFINLIKKRIVLTPGKIVAKWFLNIPKNEPFLYGCGYRMLAPILGCNYKNYGQELYDDIFPKYAAIGIQGNVNTTSFMYDYANFGLAGLVLAGFIMGFLISSIDFIFSFSLMFKFAINGFYILMLSSSALTTLIFSGGWGLMILLFFIYKSDLLKTPFNNENLPSNFSS